MSGHMRARDRFPFVVVGDAYAAYLVMCDEIDRLEAEVDRLTNDIDGHSQHYRCTPERPEP